MDIKTFTDNVKIFARNEGADLVGIAPVSRYKGAPRLLRPEAHLPEAKSVIVMAIHHPDASVEWGAEPNSNFPGPFQIGMIPKLDTISSRVARFVEEQGYISLPFPCTYYWRHRPYKDIPYAHAASFSHMNAFIAAGLGEYGWHGMVMSPEYGPRQRIISVLTSAPLIADPLYKGEALCDRCGQCERACYGNNYKEEHLLTPSTISFKMEGKKFEYANINRWRCFWGEQCHLDMNRLADEKDLDEEKIYNAMDRGIQRIAIGGAGYMCASFKYCMAKPVRRWKRTMSPGPKRKKKIIAHTWPKIRDKIISCAKAVGADRIAVQPLNKFTALKDNFHQGFRTEQLFDSFEWVISIGRSLPSEFNCDLPLYKKNKRAVESINYGRLMMGSMDIARYLDNLGYEAMQAWGATDISEFSKNLAGWESEYPDTVFVQSVICQAPLQEELISIPCPLDNLTIPEFNESLFKKNPHIDIFGAVRMDKLEFAEGVELRRLIPEGRTLLAIGVELPKRAVELAGVQEAECAMSYQFINYQALREAFWAAQDIASSLAAKNHFAVPLLDLVPNSIGRFAPYVCNLPDMRAQSPFAAATGVGALGKSGLLISEKFGPRQRFAFVITSAELNIQDTVMETSPCPKDCSACVEACPMTALDGTNEILIKVSPSREYPVFKRNDLKCQWARSLGMEEKVGSGLLGWQLPKLPVPDKLDKKTKEAALQAKDPIQRRCYCNPNHSDTQVERCLQVCPL